ncbi:DUF4260 domain-containing protein [Gracilimonas sp.]|uniref:DUF4260 domain-containing protein n=1 Tax=Gracilimonas sp. TaxID=1974203 RepID=UPI0032F062CC
MKIELNFNLRILLILEEILLFTGSVILFGLITGYTWWMYALLFFLPDVSFAAYLINTKTGAFFYNLLHHKGVMISLILLGYFAQLPMLVAIGIVFLGHSAFDRIFGYGLKFGDDFKHTHLGYLNQDKNT